MNDIYVCPDCGGENVSEPVWKDTNTGNIADNIDWIKDICYDCGGEISGIILKEDFVGEVSDE